jgi:hypothetical protein
MKSRSEKVRKVSQKRAVAIAVGRAGDDEPSFAFAWRKDSIAILVAAAAATAIIANAAFLQKGQHPAPLFGAKPAAPAGNAPKLIRVVGQEMTGPPLPVVAPKPRPVEAEALKPEAVMLPRPRAEGAPARAPQLAAAEPNDPIGELIAPSSKRVLAVQRALAEFGFGQIRPNGNMGPETKAAIAQFERSRKMPVTGQISPRLLRELSALTGRPLE